MDFAQAVSFIASNRHHLNKKEEVVLYGLYMQAVEGPKAASTKPDDPTEAAKWISWQQYKHLPQNVAQQFYQLQAGAVQERLKNNQPEIEIK